MKGNKIIKAGVGYTIGNYLIRGLTFLTIPIFARIMSTSDYGIYNIFIAYEGIFVYLIGFGFETSLKKAYFKYGLNENISKPELSYEGYVSTAVSVIVFNAVIWIALSFIFREQATNLLQLDFPSIIMLMIFSMGNAIVLCYNAHASITYNFKGFVKIAAINAVGNISISILLIHFVFRGQTYIGRMLGSTSVIFLIAVCLWIYFLNSHKPDHLRDYMGWGLKFCLPIMPHGISQVILVNFDRIMIGRMVGSDASGMYSFAYNIFSIIYVTYRSLDPVWGTWFFERMNEGRYKDIKQYSSLYILIVLLISVGIIFVSPELVSLLGSAKYRDSIYCVIPIVAGGFFAFLYSVPCQVEYYREKTNYLAGATVCAALVNIIFNYIFIKMFGYVAAAYTTLITYMLYFLFHFLLAYRIERRQLFSQKTIIFCSIVILIVSGISLITIQHVMIRCVFAVIVLLAILLYVWRENKELLIQYVRRK